VEIVAYIVVMVAMVAASHYWGKQAKQPRRASLTEATLFMENGELDPSDPTLSGRIDGLAVTFRLIGSGSGSNSQGWTECEVATSTAELDIALRPQTRGEERWVDKGLARDVVVGDDEFDDKFIVEAAPADLAKRALDEGIRAELLTHHPVEVKSRPEGLLVNKQGWIEEPEAIRAFAEMCAHLASSMQEAVADAHQDDQRDDAQAGYRGASPKAQRESGLEACQQTDELKALRKKREKTESTHVLIIFVLLGLALFAWVYAQRCF